jgi:hypothetical protein
MDCIFINVNNKTPNNNNNFEKYRYKTVRNSTDIIEKIIDANNYIVQGIELLIYILFIIILVYLGSFLYQRYFLYRTRNYVIIC